MPACWSAKWWGRQGTQKMREVADAVREGAWAYLMRQAKALLPLVFLVTAILYFTAETTHAAVQSVERRLSSWGPFSPGWSGLWE